MTRHYSPTLACCHQDVPDTGTVHMGASVPRQQPATCHWRSVQVIESHAGDLSRRHGEEERCSNCHLDGNHPATGPGLPSPAAEEQVPSLDQGQGTHHHEDCPSPHPDTSVDTAYTAGAPRPPPHPTLPPGPPQRPTYRLVARARRRSENHAKTAAGYTGLATVATQGWLHC